MQEINSSNERDGAFQAVSRLTCSTGKRLKVLVEAHSATGVRPKTGPKSKLEPFQSYLKKRF